MSEQENKNSTAPILQIFRASVPLVCLLLSLAIGLVAYFAVILGETNSKYIPKSPVYAFLLALIISSCIFSFAAIFLLRQQKKKPSLPFLAKLFSFLPACAVLYSLFHIVTQGVGDWDLAFIFASLITAIFFITKPFEKLKILNAISAFAVFIFATLIIALLYLDFDIELNSTFKLAVQFGAVALILGAIADARASLSRISSNWFVFLKGTSLSLSMLCSGVIFTAFCSGYTVFPDSYLVFTIVYFCHAVSVAAELITISVRSLN